MFEGLRERSVAIRISYYRNIDSFSLTNQEGVITMKITDVRVRKVTKQGKMRAVVSVTFDNEFVVHDIKVIEGERGLFIAMPSKKSTDGEYRDIAHPINSDMRKVLQDTILEAYDKAADEVVAEGDSAPIE